MEMESASNGSDEKSKRHPRWTRQETMTLIQAKDITERSPNKGRKMTILGGLENTEPKWVMISSYCKQQGVNRGPAQCRKRWSNLIGDFKKVKSWESKLKDKGDSFWIMRNDLRKENKLPISFDFQVFKVLEGREMSATSAVSPLPLQAIASVCEEISEYGDGDGDGDDEEGMEEEEVGEDAEEELEPEPEPKPEPEHEPEVEPTLGVFKEPWPGISYWDSQGRGKKRRLSTDNHQENNIKAHIIRVLETNNKILNAQLDVHNKNCQLDREQRKDNNEALVATLDKLTDALVKITEKL